MEITLKADTMEQIIETCRDMVEKFDDASEDRQWKYAILAPFMVAVDKQDEEAICFYRDWYKSIAG